MIVHRCDRCKTDLSKDVKPALIGKTAGWLPGSPEIAKYQLAGNPADMYELCPNCVELFDQFMQAKALDLGGKPK